MKLVVIVSNPNLNTNLPNLNVKKGIIKLIFFSIRLCVCYHKLFLCSFLLFFANFVVLITSAPNNIFFHTPLIFFRHIHFSKEVSHFAQKTLGINPSQMIFYHHLVLPNESRKSVPCWSLVCPAG